MTEPRLRSYGLKIDGRPRRARERHKRPAPLPPAYCRPLARHRRPHLTSQSQVHPQLASHAFPPLRYSRWQPHRHTSPAVPTSPCPTFRDGSQWLLSGRIAAGPGVITRAFGDPGAELRAYRNLRDSVEAQQLQPKVGFYIEPVHSSGFFARIGLDYAMYRSNLRSTGPETQTTTLVEVRDPLSGSVIRTDTTVEIARTTSTVYNRVQTLTPVVGLGYQRTFGRVTPYVLGQVGYEVTLKRRGVVPTRTGTPADLNGEEAYVTSTPGFQYGGVAGFDVSLHAKWALGVGVQGLWLGSLQGAAEEVDYRQRAVVPTVNLVYRW